MKSRNGLQFDPQKLSFRAEVKENPKDRVEVVVGDDKDPSKFQPQVKIQRWDNEVNSSIRLVLPEADEVVTQTPDEKIVIERDDLDVRMYERDDLEEGGFEFEIVLKEVPKSNVFEFTVNTKELDWFYQPALTQEEIDEGASRPDNVVGSYAVYHKTRGGMNDAAGMEYKVGKAFHVYRPHVVDANGSETWGTLELDEVSGILKISVDQTWLNNAIYPVIVDPTFGYTTAGATALGPNLDTKCGTLYQLVGGGNVSKITSYSAVNGNNINQRCGIYSQTAGAPDALLGSTTETSNTQNYGAAEAPAWFDFTFSSAVSLTSGNYYLVEQCSVAHRMYYDTTGASRVLNSDTYSDGLSDPFGSPTAGTERLSIYATFTSHSLIHAQSDVDAGFTAGHPFASGAAKDYTVQSALSPDTYYWRVAAKDVSAGTAYGDWATTRSFTITGGGGGGAVPATGFMTTNTGFWGT